MKAERPSSSDHKAITSPEQARSTFMPPRRLFATAVIGAALIGYLVHKTPDSRQRLETMAEMAQALGVLSESDAAVVAKLLANPTIKETAHA